VAGVSEGLIRQIENGTNRATSLPVGLKIARALDVDAWWLASGQEEPVEARFDRIEARLEALEHEQRKAREAVQRRS
jgi:transcriptional regulator with XRE-family HTH domain